MLSRQGSISSAMSNAHRHPQKIGPWRLGKTLGRGATGSVLLGVHQTTCQKAAVKVVSKLDLNEEYEQPQDRQGGLPYGIEREIIIMKLLTHPNVLRLYDVWETSKALYLVLEYVEGGELFDLLVERGPLQEQEAVKYFRQIILGTAYCHALGICHRDLKPENLLLDGNLNVKLADFGMAALESNGKLLETSCGSPHYAAPEIVSGLKYHGAASDVWSCGVILFALLTGRLPFDDENIRNLLLKVQAGTFEMPQELSPEAQDLIWRMLTVDPMERLSTSEVLHHQLLNKYPCPNEDLISVKSLPHPQTAYKSLGLVKNIDKQILGNLLILWNQRPEHEIVQALLRDGQNPEKTFYALLLRYRHAQDDATLNPPITESPRKHIPRSSSGLSNRASTTPRRNKMNQKSASSFRNRPVSFQRRYGGRTPGAAGASAGHNSTHSSVNNSPLKLPLRDIQGYRMSPSKSPRKRQSFQVQGGPLPRDTYNEIMAAAHQNESYISMPPTLPSKDSIYANVDSPATTAMVDYKDGNRGLFETLDAAPALLLKTAKSGGNLGNPGIPGHSAGASTNKRILMMKRSSSRMSRRKSIRHSLTTGMKRNLITIKLLSTYAKLASETDWEYMDKQAKRTSATFGILCDKIFNHEEYDEEDEKLIDEEERRARDYEKLMERERKKHEAELRARRELAKQQKRQQRRSLFASSKKLHITVTEDGGRSEPSDIRPGKRASHSQLQLQRQANVNHALRALSEGENENGDDNYLSSAEIEALKQRSVTQPIPKRRLTPILTRRPVSRLDPLWIAHENKEIMRSQDPLQAEFKELEKLRKKNNRESMVSFGSEPEKADKEGRKTRLKQLKNVFELPEHETADADLSEEYLSEIRKSRLLNLQLNLNSAMQNGLRRGSKIEEKKTLIGSVHIPKVTRKSRNFTNSNKRLSLLSVKSTKESYRDLNSFLDTHNEDLDEDELNEEEQLAKSMPALRTSFADRLDHVGTLLADIGDEDDASIMDFDEHLAKKRTSYYAGTAQSFKDGRRKSVFSTKSRGEAETRGSGQDADYTFADDESKLKSSADEVFESIKLPESKAGTNRNCRGERHVRASQPSTSTMLLPNLKDASVPVHTEARQPKPRASTKEYGMLEEKPNLPAHENKPLVNSTNLKPSTDAEVPGKRNRSIYIFRKLSWGAKKLLDDEHSHLPSPAHSSCNSVGDVKGSGSGIFLRIFSSSKHAHMQAHADAHTYKIILPKQEMMSALFALLNSWTNFGLKDLKRDNHGNNILGSISKHNTFNFKSCKFRIQIAQREKNQKSKVICVHTKGSAATSKLLFQEIQRVLEKEGVMDT